MARHERFDSEIEELAEDFGHAAGLMVRIVLSFLRGEAALDDAMSALTEATTALLTVADTWVDEVLPRVYGEGAHTSLSSPETPDASPEALSGEAHDEALTLFQEELSDELASTTRRMTDDAKATLREIGRRRLAATLDGGSDVRGEMQKMERELTGRGVKFIDRGGREWDPKAYSRMVLRTHTVSAANEGVLNTAAELGSPGVRVRDGGPGDVDEPCRKADGEAWSLAYARANRLEHPQCRRSFAPLASTWSGKLDRE